MSFADTRSKISQSTRSSHFPAAMLVLLALTASVRLPGIARPLLGNFSTKNVVYAMIARNLAEGRAGLWHPTLDVLCGGQRGWHMLEFPVSAYLTGGLWRLFGGSLDVWGRATSVAFSVGSVAVMYWLVRRRHGRTAAMAAGLVLALSPISIIYGQSFMLEASLVFFTLTTFYALDRRLDGGGIGWLAVAAGALGLLLLTKIYMIVILLPLAVTVFASRRSAPAAGESVDPPLPASQSRPRRLLIPAAVLAIIPAVFWYAHACTTASAGSECRERVYYSLLDSAAEHRPPHPLLGSADFYRQLLDDLSGIVLTPIGFVLVLTGLLDRSRREYAAWLAAMLILIVLLPRKFYEMNYYWMAVLPPLCVLAGLGWKTVVRRLRPGRLAVGVVLSAAVLFSFRYGVFTSFVTPDEDRCVIAAGRVMRELAAEGEPVVTMHGTSIDLLYYCDRSGWSVDPNEPHLKALIRIYLRQGARYMVVVGRRPTLPPPVKSGNGYAVYPLASIGYHIDEGDTEIDD